MARSTARTTRRRRPRSAAASASTRRRPRRTSGRRTPGGAKLGTSRPGGRHPARAQRSSHRGLVTTPGELANHRRQVDALGDQRAAPVPGVRERPVGGQDQPDRTGRPGPLDAGDDGVASAGPVGLEQRLRVGRDDVLDRLAGERAEPDGDATRRGGAGDGDLTVGVHGLHAGRRDEHRHRERLTHHGGRHLAASAGWSATTGRKPSSAKAATLSLIVVPRSEPATRAS